MIDLPDDKAIKLFRKTNDELLEFYDSILYQEWGKFFGGNTPDRPSE